MKSIQSRGLNLNNKKILIRLDLNVPLNGTNITDTNRIDKTIPTLQYLLKNNAKIIILSHIGRPKGKVVNELSLKPVCDELEKKLDVGRVTYGGSGGVTRTIDKQISDTAKQLGLFDGRDPRFKQQDLEFELGSASSQRAKATVQAESVLDPLRTRRPGEDIVGDILGRPPVKKVKAELPITDLDDLASHRGRVDVTKILNKIGKNPKQVAKNLKAGVVTRPKKGEIEAAREIIKKFNSTISPVEQMRFNMAKGFKGMLESIGGTPLVKSTRKLLSNTVGRIPFLGDLIGLLLDIFVFGEPVGRAAFMAIGGILGGFLGAAVGSLIPGPGTLIGGILGGLGGDIVGGLLYDLIFGRKPKVTPESAVTKGTVRGVSKTVKGFDEGGLVPRFQPSKLRVDDPMDKSINLRSFAFYERSQSGKEKMIPIPIPIPQESTNQQGQMIVVNNSGKQQTNNFSQLYRRG